MTIAKVFPNQVFIYYVNKMKKFSKNTCFVVILLFVFSADRQSERMYVNLREA